MGGGDGAAGAALGGGGRKSSGAVVAGVVLATLASVVLLLWGSGGHQEALQRLQLRQAAPAATCGHVAVGPIAPADWRLDLPSANGYAYDPTAAAPVFGAAWRAGYDKAVDTKDGATSQWAEDLYAYQKFFYGLQGGTYLEIGGLDGLTFSNTHFFHKQLGWRGVLIEGSPASYPRLLQNRPADVRINAAVCAQRQMVHYATSNDGAVHGILEFMSDAFKEKWHRDDTAATTTPLLCLPLGEMLAHLGVRHIDLFSLDVEGGELGVLESVDFRCVTFNVLVVEADGTNPDKDGKVRGLLAREGYAFHGHEATNDWFVRRGWTPSAAP